VRHIEGPTLIKAEGDPPKSIEEFVGRVNTGTEGVSIARMKSPAGWSEPGQTPGFTEYTVVFRGSLRVTTKEGVLDVGPGESVVVDAGEWVQYGSPAEGGAEYVSVCIPAFSPDTVHRDGV
jgi:mannose-6-phosphate isomerase-like protein (cupin superfamily)